MGCQEYSLNFYGFYVLQAFTVLPVKILARRERANEIQHKVFTHNVMRKLYEIISINFFIRERRERERYRLELEAIQKKIASLSVAQNSAAKVSTNA